MVWVRSLRLGFARLLVAAVVVALVLVRVRVFVVLSSCRRCWCRCCRLCRCCGRRLVVVLLSVVLFRFGWSVLRSAWAVRWRARSAWRRAGFGWVLGCLGSVCCRRSSCRRVLSSAARWPPCWLCFAAPLFLLFFFARRRCLALACLPSSFPCPALSIYLHCVAGLQ